LGIASGVVVHNILYMFLYHHDHHHHQITKLSHSINAIGPAPHRSGRKRERRSMYHHDVVFSCKRLRRRHILSLPALDLL
jgi:hypothetical protein